VDAVVVEAANANDMTWRAISLAGEFPSAPFFALLPLRPVDAAVAARSIAAGCVDLIVEGVDEVVARPMISAVSFSTRLRRALAHPPESLGLSSSLQENVWREIVSRAGTPVSTDALARSAGLSREHLSRKFSNAGSPNLKRIIDLVRIIAAAELAKNPGLDVRDVARVLGFASSSHLAVATARIAGTRPASLARLRGADIVERFAQGRGRSRS
jgi:transcriptional regulator GlxA family with amidase domain